MDVVESFGHGDPETPRFSDDFGSGSACSTPFVSAPSSPGRGPPPGYFFSAPSSPMHFFLCSASSSSSSENPKKLNSSSCGDFEFDFSSRLSSSSGPSMTSAEELFSNGQIKPMKLSSHLQRPQILSPLLDLENEEDDEDDDEDAKTPDGEMKRGRDLKLRSRSVHRKARSLSPLRNAAYHQWSQEDEEEEEGVAGEREVKECIIRKLQEDENVPSAETTPSCSASSSRSSSYGRNSKKWIFLKDLLHRSKSEGRGNAKEKFWSNISFSPSNFKDKKLKSPQPAAEEKPIQETVVDESKKQKQKQPPAKKTPTVGKPTNGIAKRRGSQPSAHELHYTTNRAQAEEMKKRTYLPYRHGLFGCLGFSSKGYSALNGLARSLNPVSSG
ncbi:PREDICTED: uncharacterized protein LOC104749061 [Camelina sativa]|uniref:Uncharacterized protein LOC104749061 n=1 Tax=Camelina sativa TaxID=90675 RepID=A0ABM0WC41_CAMSA|nr:PREDICTED: uncharacterized protein LOC104749061 [Camelina sativa]